jgi:hypothetical protein
MRRASVRLAASAAVVLVAGVINATGAEASGHTYEVVQCDPLNRGSADAVLEDSSPYAARSFCGDPHDAYSIKVDNVGHAQHGGFGRVRWATGSADLSIVAVDVRAKLRRDNGHAARLWVGDEKLNQVAGVATGGDGATAFKRYRWSASGRGSSQFVAGLSCERPAGCRRSDAAKTWVRGVRMKVADHSDPVFATLDGSLLSKNWLRGDQRLRADSDDLGSGLDRIVLRVNGSVDSLQRGSCDAIPVPKFSPRMVPCASEAILNDAPKTASSPFHDGANAVGLCAIDFAGNRTCAFRDVRVDNTPPAVSFAATQDPDDPELVRAPVHDATSGVKDGTILYRPVGQSAWQPLGARLRHGALQGRVDSIGNSPGRYEFAAYATDVAGNVARTTTRADGRPMILEFPLKTASRLSAHLAPGGASRLTVGYGHGAKVAGRLRDAAGRPLGGQPVTVTERFGAGALIDRRVRTVMTDPDGLWGERLPAGPSRRVTATFDGTRRYLSDDKSAGGLHVKTKATFHLSRPRVREGRRVVFRGRVAHLAARIPAGGKLIELQVKDGPQWHTVRQTFSTHAGGHYKMRYRFARFYTSNVSYRFRVKVLREQGWPYKAPVSSRARRLVVKAR